MTVWNDVVGQPAAVATLQRAAELGNGAHAWLVTGPPGSGRSVAARAYAAALQCPQGGCGECDACKAVLRGNHPDVEFVTTSGTTLDIDRVRELVGVAQRHPAVGQWRVILVEDADRMAERTWNVLLKAIEEPPAKTVWLLCAPSADDVLPTIRSRCRVIRLVTPDPVIVAEYLVARDGVDPQLAEQCARAAQSHIGVARRLARDPASRDRRRHVLELAYAVSGVGDAVKAAARLHELGEAEATEATTERNAEEKAELMRWLGIEDAKRVPPTLRAQVRRLEEDQKRRVTRLAADVMDRMLTDLQSVYRDVLVRQMDVSAPLTNLDAPARVEQAVTNTSLEQTLTYLDAIADCRRRVTSRIMLNRLLALEALMVQLIYKVPAGSSRR